MRILLTGSSGFLGSFFFDKLSQYHVVDTISRTNSKFHINLVKEIPSFELSYDVVIHCAGRAHYTPGGKTEIREFYRENIDISENLLLGLSKTCKPSNFVFISSVAVYGKSVGHLINEQSELNAMEPYGISKVQAEQLILKWCTENNVTCTILRLPLVVGLNPPGNLGDMIKGIRKGYYYNIAGGKAKKSMVLASDVAKFLLKASETGGIFNLTDGYHPSFFELSENLSRQLGKSRTKNLPFWLAKYIARTGDVFGAKAPLNSLKLKKITSDLTFDDSKAREAFGWHPTPVLEGFDISEII